MKTLCAILLLLGFALPPARAADVRVFNTLADLAAWVPSPSASNFVVRTFDSSRPFASQRPGHYDATSVASTNLGCVYATSTGVGRNLMDDCNGGELNATWFGATGDGTTDDTQSISNAIAASIALRGTTGGGGVYVPSGEYLVNLRLPLDTTNQPSVTLRGNGPGSTAFRPYTNTSPVLTVLGRNVFIRDFQLKGDYDSPSGIGLQISDSTVTNGVFAAGEIRNLLIYDFAQGIKCDGVEQTLLENVSILRCTNALAIHTRDGYTGYNNNVIGKVRVSRCSFTEGYGDAVTIQGGLGTQLLFDTCTFEQNDGGAVVVEQTHAGDGNPIRNVGFDNCFFEFNHRSIGPGDYYDIEFKAATGTGVSARYTSSITRSWFQRSSSTHWLLRIDNPGNYIFEGNDYIVSGTNYISLSDKDIILRTDVSPLTKVEVDGGGTTPSINSPESTTMTATRLEVGALTDTAPAFILDVDGVFGWSDTTNAPDIEMYRSAAGVLRLDGTLRFSQTDSLYQALFTGVTGDSQGRFSLDVSGLHEWGSGSAARDAKLYRSGAGELTLTTNVIVTGSTTVQKEIRSQQAAYTDQSYFSGQTGDSVGRFSIQADGEQAWGSGLATRDTTLKRSGIGTLTVVTNLVVSGDLYAKTVYYSNTNTFDDLQFNVSTLDPVGIATPPALVANSGRDGEALAAVFNASDVTLINIKMPHTWVQESTIYPHLHIEPQTANAITNTWIVKYSIASIGGTFPAWTVQTNTVVIAGGAQWGHKLVSLPTNGIPMTGFTGASVLVNLRFECVSVSEDTHVKSVDVHYRVRGSPVAYTP